MFDLTYTLINSINSPIENQSRLIAFASASWPPYVIDEGDGGDAKGMGVELIEALFKRIDGIDVKFPIMPWSQAIEEVKNGDKDGTFLLINTKERQSFMEFSMPLFSEQSLLWYLKDKFPNGLEWQDLGDLEGFHIGIVRGYSHGTNFDEKSFKKLLKVELIDSTEKLFSKLVEDKQLDIVIENEYVGHKFSRQYNFDTIKIEHARRPLMKDDYCIALSKKTDAKDLIPTIDDVIKQMQKEGVIKRILGR